MPAFGVVRSSSASSAHVNPLTTPFSLVSIVISTVGGRSVAAEPIDIFTCESVTGFGKVKDAVEEDEDHIDKPKHEPVNFAGDCLKFLHPLVKYYMNNQNVIFYFC